MVNPLWFVSVLVSLLFLSGFSSSGMTLSTNPSLQALQTSSTAVEPLTPADRKEIEELALLFAQKYYTFNVENYTEVNDELLTLITPEYQDVFKKITRDGLVAAQSAKAESKVESVQITEVDKLSANQAKVQLTFKAQTTTNHQTTENRYSTKLDLQKKEGHWKINAILSEQPVEFLNIRNLL